MSGFCTLCGHRVESFEGLTCCPQCGSDGVPCDNEDQVTVSINIHELRVLCIWAERWADATNAGSVASSVVYGIAHRLRQQLPEKTCLTLSDEIARLREKGYRVETNLPGDYGPAD